MQTPEPPASPEVAYIDGEVLIDGSKTAQALLVRDGRIAAVGSTAEILTAAGPDVERYDLAGNVMIPGLVDTHPHLMHFAAFAAAAVDLTGARNHADVVAAIKAAAEARPAGEWIIATPIGEPHYFLRRSWKDLEEGRLPDRDVLDAATSDHPVFIQAWAPTIPNVCVANSAALAALGLDGSTPDRVSNVWIDKDANGEPTGLLRGDVTIYYNSDPFFAELLGKMPPIIRPELVAEGTLRAMAAHNALGFTTIFEAHAMEPEMIGLYEALRAQGLLSLRVQASPELEGNALPSDQPKSLEEIDATLEAALYGRRLDDAWLRVDGVTTCAWGPAACGRMRWDSGYTDAWGNPTTGSRQISEAKMRRAMDFCAENGLRLNLLSCSPDEHDEYIALTTEVLRRHGRDSVDWLIEHGYVMRPDQPRRLAELGFDITISTSFTSGKGEMLAERIGPDAQAWLNPLRAMIDGGLTLAASTDWGPMNAFELMALAVTHEMHPHGRTNAGPDQVVTRQEAFEMWTSGAASVLRWPDIGHLAPGAHADLVVVDRNPITCDLVDLPGTRVLQTVVGGRVVHDADLSSTPSSVRREL